METPGPAKRSLFARLFNPKVGVPILIVLALAAAPFIYRDVQLSAIPDIGAPFDVEAFCKLSLPEEENAAADYLRAARMYVSRPPGDPDKHTDHMLSRWETAPPEFRQWVLDNRAAIGVWRQAARKPNAVFVRLTDVGCYTSFDHLESLRNLGRVASLEASRLRAENDMHGAWQTYADMLRSSRNIGRKGVILERLVGMSLHAVAATELVKWAADARVDEQLLGTALAECRSIFATTDPASNTLKAEYVYIRNIAEMPLSEQWKSLPNTTSIVGLYLRGDPELARRIAQHGFAESIQRISTSAEARTIPTHLSPTELDRVIPKSIIATELIMGAWRGGFANAVAREQAREAALEMALAAQIYRRRHGKFPDRVEQLLEAGLETLPVDPYGTSGQLMRYRVDETTGAVVVWSVGQDGVNDGGNFEVVSPSPRVDVGFVVHAPAEEGTR
jgi:hypothetical protein